MKTRKELVTVEWLQDNQQRENVVILDASPKKTAAGNHSLLNLNKDANHWA